MGMFYLKSKPFLHFHDAPAGIFADVKLDLTTYSSGRYDHKGSERLFKGTLINVCPPSYKIKALMEVSNEKKINYSFNGETILVGAGIYAE